jgi:hypothetical protein
MTPTELRTAIYANYKTIRAFADDIGKTQQQVFKWLNGTAPVPKMVERFFEILPCIDYGIAPPSQQMLDDLKSKKTKITGCDFWKHAVTKEKK